jgi:hypothetical protein
MYKSNLQPTKTTHVLLGSYKLLILNNIKITLLMSGNEKQQNPTSHDSELAGIAGISVSEVVDGETIVELRAEDLPTRDLERVFRRRKQLAVQRHLRIAEQYIQNIIKGKFPKIDLR